MSAPGAPPVLWDGGDFFAVAKPAGTLVIPGRGEGHGPALREILEAEQKRKIWVVHRLDLDTTGVLLFARTAQAHRALSMAFEQGRIRKVYQAIVAGTLEEPEQVELALAPARSGRMRPVKGGEAGKPALTVVRPLEALGGGTATWVEAEPLTGRTHQIRVHLAAIGHPLLVDPQYGRSKPFPEGEQAVLRRTPLHAVSIEVPRLERIAPARIDCPLPEDMEAALRLLRGS